MHKKHLSYMKVLLIKNIIFSTWGGEVENNKKIFSIHTNFKFVIC